MCGAIGFNSGGKDLAKLELYVVLFDDFHHARWRQLVGKQVVDQVHITEVYHRVAAEIWNGR